MAKALARYTKEYRNWNYTKVNHIRTTHVPRATLNVCANVYEEYLTKLYIYIYIEMLFRKIYILLDML